MSNSVRIVRRANVKPDYTLRVVRVTSVQTQEPSDDSEGEQENFPERSKTPIPTRAVATDTPAD